LVLVGDFNELHFQVLILNLQIIDLRVHFFHTFIKLSFFTVLELSQLIWKILFVSNKLFMPFGLLLLRIFELLFDSSDDVLLLSEHQGFLIIDQLNLFLVWLFYQFDLGLKFGDFFVFGFDYFLQTFDAFLLDKSCLLVWIWLSHKIFLQNQVFFINGCIGVSFF
jgi:hypothetical protein